MMANSPVLFCLCHRSNNVSLDTRAIYSFPFVHLIYISSPFCKVCNLVAIDLPVYHSVCFTRFNLIGFSKSVVKWMGKATLADEQNCHQAIEWISRLGADGNTCTLEAIQVSHTKTTNACPK